MKKILFLLAIAVAQPVAAQPDGRLLNSPDLRPHKENAIKIMDAIWEPGEPVPDKWYRDMRAESIALALYYGFVQMPGASTRCPADPRLAEVKAGLEALVRKLP